MYVVDNKIISKQNKNNIDICRWTPPPEVTLTVPPAIFLKAGALTMTMRSTLQHTSPA